MKIIKIGLVLNTRRDHSEFQVEYDPPHTLELIKHGIEATGNHCLFLEADENVSEILKKTSPDLVFNRAEGLRGESRESHVPAILEMLNIPYVGSNILTTALALNKTWTKKILTFHGIKTADFTTLERIEDEERVNFGFPVILKPNEEGSSIGINSDNVVFNREQLRTKLSQMLLEYRQKILAEQFVEGREFSVGVLGKPNTGMEVLAVVEIDFSRFPKEVGNVFGQRAKTVLDAPDYYMCPAVIPKSLKERLVQTTLRICEVLEIKDFGRIDYRMDKKGNLYFLEINPLPGMDYDLANKDFSFYPFMAARSGYDYDQLIRRLLESACARYGLNLH